MFDPNVPRVLQMLREDDLVLDIGGWACPFTRANYILDGGPYETRGCYADAGLPASQGGTREYFSADTWIQRDICDHVPFPFRDKQFDFVICSHTLEDLRDPLWVCSEMRRIGRRGYIEVPSRVAETSRGWEHPRLAGLSHHRWLIEIEGSHIVFLQKFHMLHSHWRFSFPPGFFRELSGERRMQCLFWDDSFTFEERFIHGLEPTAAELEAYVQQIHPYAGSRLAVDRAYRSAEGMVKRVVSGVRRRLQRRTSS